MTEITAAIKKCEGEIEAALASLEQPGQLNEALATYRAVETKLEALDLASEHPAYAEKQRVLAYCLMRQGNILRQIGQAQEAVELSEREIAAARASGDDVTLARSLMSYGANRIVRGEVEQGLAFMEEARSLFGSGNSYDHKQGLGWYWILRADLGNAGILPGDASEVVDAADRALAILLPLENWPGVARAHAARAQAHEALGDGNAAAADREAQSRYEKLVGGSEETSRA